MSTTSSEREKIYWLRLEHEKEGITSWKAIYEKFPHLKKNDIRRIYSREKKKREKARRLLEAPSYITQGDTIGEDDFDEEELWEQATAISRKIKERNGRKNEKEIIFSHAPVCIVFMADLHLGDKAVDYERLDRDIRTILSTPGMFVALVGDLLNNYIIGRLKAIRIVSELSVPQEWVLARRVLRLLAPKLLLSVAGNHDLWTNALTGVDFLKEIHAQLNPDIMYAKYEHKLGVRVGSSLYQMRVRHKWKGYSQYNPTHGIEWAAKFDKGRDFDIGVAAHTHVSGLYRQFNNGGKTGHAVVCGSYVFDDDYANMIGFPEPNESASVAIVIDDKSVFGTNCLESAADYMKAVYPMSS